MRFSDWNTRRVVRRPRCCGHFCDDSERDIVDGCSIVAGRRQCRLQSQRWECCDEWFRQARPCREAPATGEPSHQRRTESIGDDTIGRTIGETASGRLWFWGQLASVCAWQRQRRLRRQRGGLGFRRPCVWPTRRGASQWIDRVGPSGTHRLAFQRQCAIGRTHRGLSIRACNQRILRPRRALRPHPHGAWGPCAQLVHSGRCVVLRLAGLQYHDLGLEQLPVHRDSAGPHRRRQMHGGDACPEDVVLRVPRQNHKDLEPRDVFIDEDPHWPHK
mmetsp:Transcript_68381/g.198099  ORF Transcript_68381/g.198099 Transcript_68381/m.198099 type:complete len:274 (+) Transcript_68381:384-1205(+)